MGLRALPGTRHRVRLGRLEGVTPARIAMSTIGRFIADWNVRCVRDPPSVVDTTEAETDVMIDGLIAM